MSIDADNWTKESLAEVIKKGEDLLNVEFRKTFKDYLLKHCFLSVHIVQEACRRCCQKNGVMETLEDRKKIGNQKVAIECIKDAISEHNGRYNGFLSSFSDGFQKTDLEMYKWILYGTLIHDIDKMELGITLRDISKAIKDAHPDKELNSGNITQALKATTSLQSKKKIRPLVLHYDTQNNRLHVVDKGFLIWLQNQNINDLLEHHNLPKKQQSLE